MSVRLTVLVAALLACSDSEEKASGPTLAELQVSLLTPSCSFDACHAGPNPKAGLSLDTLDGSYASLVGVASADGAGVRVVPDKPDESLLVAVLEGPVGETRQMPVGFEMPAATVDRVRAWIAAGAIKGDPADVQAQADDVEQAGDDLPTPEDLPPPDPSEGFQMGIDTVAPAGEEIWKCLVTKLPGEGATAINRVESLQTRGVHHMDIMALGLLNLPIEEGMHECDTLYDTYAELMEEGIFLFASQNERESLKLPGTTAAVIPGNLTIMIEMHYVNPTPREVDVWSRINAYTLPVAESEAQIWGSAIRDQDINIPPGADGHVEWTRCEMNRDIELIILSSHTHQLAEYVDVYFWDGEERTELVYENDDWHAPQLKQFDPPMAVKTGQGFEFRCHYNNPGESTVNWGFAADDEMCQIAIVHTPFNLAAECQVTESGVGAR